MTFDTDRVPSPLDIGLDLDEVGYRFVEDARRIAIDYLGCRPGNLTPAQRWDFLTDWGIDDDDFWGTAEVAHANGDLWTSTPPISGYRETIIEMLDIGHRIHVVTARPEYATDSTRGWFELFDIPYTSLTLNHDKSAVPTDVFLDDNPKNLDTVGTAGTVGLCWAQPWNESTTHRRVSSWDEFSRYVTYLSATKAERAA